MDTKYNFLNSFGSAEEMLGAYIEGNLTHDEEIMVESLLSENKQLEDSFNDICDDIAHDCNAPEIKIDGAESIMIDQYFDKLDIESLLANAPKMEDICTKETLGEAFDNGTFGKTFGYDTNYELENFDPYVWQGYDNSCGARAQEIVLRDYGIMIPKENLIDFATQQRWFDPDPINGGTPKQSLGNLLDTCHIGTTRTENATIYDIIAELRAGHRVIVSVDCDELWIAKEPNLFKRLHGQVVNRLNDGIQNLKGIEGANHAIVVAGVNVNPDDPQDITVNIIDSGTGEVCAEYTYEQFYDAWKDGNCLMVSTNVPAPYQYNYETHMMEPSGFATEYTPSTLILPDGLTNRFALADTYYTEFSDFVPPYDEDTYTPTPIDEYLVTPMRLHESKPWIMLDGEHNPSSEYGTRMGKVAAIDEVKDIFEQTDIDAGNCSGSDSGELTDTDFGTDAEHGLDYGLGSDIAAFTDDTL